ncbi:hypothetical protein Trydic_g10666 [Trypoxylus dichotomus]
MAAKRVKLNETKAEESDSVIKPSSNEKRRSLKYKKDKSVAKKPSLESIGDKANDSISMRTRSRTSLDNVHAPRVQKPKGKELEGGKAAKKRYRVNSSSRKTSYKNTANASARIRSSKRLEELNKRAAEESAMMISGSQNDPRQPGILKKSFNDTGSVVSSRGIKRVRFADEVYLRLIAFIQNYSGEEEYEILDDQGNVLEHLKNMLEQIMSVADITAKKQTSHNNFQVIETDCASLSPKQEDEFECEYNHPRREGSNEPLQPQRLFIINESGCWEPLPIKEESEEDGGDVEEGNEDDKVLVISLVQ